VTDASPRQDTPENEDGHPPADNAQGTRTQETPQWSQEQPAPAPWYLGQPGAVPPPPPGWPQAPLPPAPPMPPPTADQVGWPEQAPGMRPGQQSEPGQGQQPGQGQPQGQQQGQGQAQGPGGPPVDAVPPWTGQAPPNPEQPADGAGSGPAAGQQPPAPWLDPNRYSQQPGSRPPNPGQRPPYGPPQPPQRREEPGERPPLSLRTRWARGLAIGGALCTLITLLNGYRNFPAWLIGAAVGLVMSLAALWFGVFAQRDAVRQSERAPEAVASVVWSGISTLIALGVVAMSLIFYPQLRQYSDCMRAANTIAGQTLCQQQLDNSLTFKP
jgi:hypothetical protein